jgi:hypothetical protein
MVSRLNCAPFERNDLQMRGVWKKVGPMPGRDLGVNALP